MIAVIVTQINLMKNNINRHISLFDLLYNINMDMNIMVLEVEKLQNYQIFGR